ncbi:hypothetical protein TanjilG_16245 [Lupinus angustifolius]|uniref:PPC domain-containing protein n=2 Tax=Lupinus angustifolius TaxID=3871 RepID=A0A1J7GKP9_LUPAN|nr:hypothetical protein TanjilG_16245 [Lupinus angustifolius]
MSNTSEEEPFDLNTLNSNGDVTNGWSCPHRKQPSSSIMHHHSYYEGHSPPEKKPRGRPPGSKNKPKPPIVITRNNDDIMKPILIEVSNGSDVVEALIKFARRYNVCISVLSGSGSIANVTLHHPLPFSTSFTVHGPFTLLTLTGTYLFSPSHRCLSFPSMAASSSSSRINPNHLYSTPTSSFGITLLGSQGEIVGGVVAGKVIAGSIVSVMVTVFKNPEFYKIGFNGNDGGGVDEDDHNPNASGNDNMSGFLIPQNHYVDVNAIQWGQNHTPNSTCPRNY